MIINDNDNDNNTKILRLDSGKKFNYELETLQIVQIS